MSGSDPHVRRAAIGDEPILRDLRLQAMLESPAAFGSDYERELRRTDADWRKWMSPGATFILESEGRPLGIVAGVRDAEESDVIHLMAMWLEPSLRGSSAADLLVSAVIEWGRTLAARFVRLDVFADNPRARRFYTRCGFVETGQETRRESDARVEVRMERRIPERASM